MAKYVCSLCGTILEGDVAPRLQNALCVMREMTDFVL